METILASAIRQINEIREQMRLDDVAIAKSVAEIRTLRAEADRLKNETQIILADLKNGAPH